MLQSSNEGREIALAHQVACPEEPGMQEAHHAEAQEARNG